MDSNLIIAKQKAHLSKGSNFYVTKQGIKRDYDLMSAEYEYKVYFKDGLYVEDFQGNKIEKPEKKESGKSGNKKTTVSPKLRNTTDEKVSEDVE